MQHAGPGVVQLWGVPSSTESQLLPGGLPQLLALLWHEGRVCWDLAWCPDPSAFIAVSSNSTGSSKAGEAAAAAAAAAQQAVPLQGLLAAVLGNGDVVVWAVPTITYLQELAEDAGVGVAAVQQQQQQQDVQQPVQPLSLQLSPLMQLPCSAVGGSMGSCCSWLPAAPHDQLLVGCWDGNVAIWQLPTTSGGLDRGCR
jgi:hypothetical protein